MRMCTSVGFRTAAATGLLLLGAAGVGWAAGGDEPSAYTRAMETFIATLDKAKTIQFEMTISSRRAGGGLTAPEVRRYRVSVSRPDRLAVVPLTPETARFGMASDGEEVLCYTPRSRQYCVVDAPETLRGMDALVFGTVVRDLELCLALQPFIKGTTDWKGREPCDLGSAEVLGETQYAGVPCQMFLGSSGDVAYFEKDKRALYRGSQTTGEGSRLSGSGQWVTGEIAAVTIDKWTLDGAISASEFSVKPPAGYQRVKDPKGLPPEPDASGRTASAGPTADLPANASPAELRQRAWALIVAGCLDLGVTTPLFQRAADKGDPLAGMWIAYLQQNGAPGFTADAAAAANRARAVAPEVKRLAAAGDPEAQYLWGLACQYGLGMPADPAEAGRWTVQAAANGHVIAMYNVGTMLRSGQADLKDEVWGVQLVEKAARKGDYYAVGEMGFFYHWGVGVVPDRGKALEWYMKAMELGFEHTQDVKMLTRCENPHPFTADAIRAVPYVKLLGTRVEAFPKAAVAAGIVPADAVLLPPASRGERWVSYCYKKNGIDFVNGFGRMWVVQLYTQGVDGFDQFRGPLPLGLAWDDTRESVIKKLGQPDDQGDVAGDNAYGMAYIIDDLTLAVMFDFDAPGHVKLVRIKARWAPKTQAVPPTAAPPLGGPAPRTPAPGGPVTGAPKKGPRR